jgi:ketosteroid isomerase-like protein
MNTETSIRDWFRELQACVQAVDYDRAQKIFAPDVVGFGTYKDIAEGLATLRAEQWSNIWPTIQDFTFRLDQLRWGAQGDLAWAICPWDSTGRRDDGRRSPGPSGGDSPYYRPGRATIVLERREGTWLAVHTHFSLYPDVKPKA